MPSTTLKRRWTEQGMRGKAPKERKRVKKQKYYHSSSEDDEDEGGARDAPLHTRPVDLTGSNAEELQPRTSKSQPKLKATAPARPILKHAPPKPKEVIDADDLEVEEDQSAEEDTEGSEDDGNDASDISEDSDVSETSTAVARKVRKRNDPEAFATSISKILATKLTTQKRSEPILSRSKSAQETNKSLSDHKLTLKANRALLAEKRAAQEKGRVKDVLGLQKEHVSTAEIVTEEKRLRRTAQKGVIKLFNAVRAAQVKGEQAEKEARSKGVVGLDKREERVKEMSKQGFLDMIAGGGKKKEETV